MSPKGKTIIYTDLDGTFLDSKNYSFRESAPALRAAQEKGIPVIFCSSKTRAEIEYLRKKASALQDGQRRLCDWRVKRLSVASGHNAVPGVYKKVIPN